MRQSDSRMRIRKYIVMFTMCLCVSGLAGCNPLGEVWETLESHFQGNLGSTENEDGSLADVEEGEAISETDAYSSEDSESGEAASSAGDEQNSDQETDDEQDAQVALTDDEKIIEIMDGIADARDCNYDTYTDLPVYTKSFYFDEALGSELYAMHGEADNSSVWVNFEGTWNRTGVDSGMAAKLEITNQTTEGFDVSGYILDYSDCFEAELKAYFLRYDLAICEFAPCEGKTGYIIFERIPEGMNIYATGMMLESEYTEYITTIVGAYTREEPEYTNATRVEDNFTKQELADIRTLLGDDYYENYFYQSVRYGTLDVTKVVLDDGRDALFYKGSYVSNFWDFELIKCANGDLYCKVCLLNPVFFTNVEGAVDFPEYEIAKATEQEKIIAQIQSGSGWFDAELGDELWNGRPDGPVKGAADFTGEWERTDVHNGLPAYIDISNQDEEGFDVSGGVGYFSHGGLLEDGRAYFITDTVAIYEYNGCYLVMERTKAGMNVYVAESVDSTFPFGAGCSMDGEYTLGEPEYTNAEYMNEHFTKTEQAEIKKLLGDDYEMYFEDVVNYGVVDDWTCELSDGTKAVFYDGWFPTMGYCNFRMLICENGDIYCEVGNECNWYTNVSDAKEMPEYRIMWY